MYSTRTQENKRRWYERKMKGKLEDVGNMGGGWSIRGKGRGSYKGKIRGNWRNGRNWEEGYTSKRGGGEKEKAGEIREMEKLGM